MAVEILHLVSCVMFVMALIRRANSKPPSKPNHRKMLPYALTASLLGLVMPFRILMEWFVASYSGAIYEVGGISLASMGWMLLMLPLGLLPISALLPAFDRRPNLLIFIGGVGAIPSIVSLASTVEITR